MVFVAVDLIFVESSEADLPCDWAFCRVGERKPILGRADLMTRCTFFTCREKSALQLMQFWMSGEEETYTSFTGVFLDLLSPF